MMTRILLCVWVICLALMLHPNQVSAIETTGFVAGNCIKSTIPENRTVECGTVTLPLYYDQSKSGVVELPVMIVRSATATANPPLYMLQGGPGGDTISTFSYLVAQKNSVLPRDRDIIFFEQRGTTYATPTLDCPEVHADSIAHLNEKVTRAESLVYAKKSWQQCRDRLSASGVDLAAFNSLASADDVAAIATQFGHTSIDVYGVSYGTLLAQHVAERHPNLVHALILDGVVPKDREPNFEYQVSMDEAFRNLFADCAASTACATSYPNLQTRYVELVAKLNAEPLSLDLIDNDTDIHYQTRIDGEAFVNILFQLHYDTDLIPYLPMLITQVANGQYEFFTVFAGFTVLSDSVSEGFYNTVTCSEETIPRVDEMILPAQPLIPIAADVQSTDVAWYQQTCDIAAVPALTPSVNAPFNSDIPTLLMSGRYDPITPASMGNTVAKGLPHATHIVVPSSGHGAFISNACAAQIGMAFLANPQATPDTQCIATQKVVFVTPDTLSSSTLPIRLLRGESAAYGALAMIGGAVLVFLMALVLRPLAWVMRVVLQRAQPSPATRTLFGVQWLLILVTMVWMGYVAYVCFDLINPSGNYGYQTFFGVPTSYHLATTAYAYIAAVLLGAVITVRTVRTRTAAGWTTFATSVLLLTSVVLVSVIRYVGLFGG